jgi:hypothetical protein
MMKTSFGNWKLTAVAVGLVMTAILTGHATRATRQPSATVANVDLSSELRQLDSYANDLSAFDKTFDVVSRKQSLTKNEFDGLQRRAEDLKQRLSGLQAVIGEIIRRLKAADQWEKLDDTVLAQITNARVRNQLSQIGFKRLLEETASQLSSDGNEITGPIELLNRKVAANLYGSDFDGRSVSWHVVPAHYRAEPLLKQSLRCSLSSIRAGIYGFVQHSPVQVAPKGSKGEHINDEVNCYCGGQAAACQAL